MNLNELPLEHSLLTERNIAIKLVGVGGAGSNAVDRLKMENLERLQLAVVNTDYQALASSPVQDKVLIGMTVTRGLGAGGDPEHGREAAEADREKIAKVVKDCDLVFLIGGMGGGTGSGAMPVVAEIAAEHGALVISFVTMPFIFGFAVSWGPVAWLVCYEIFPLEGREVGMTITTMVNWTFAGLVMANALSFMQAHGNSSIFYVFAGFCLLAIAFVAFFVPETKGITLEEMEFNLKNGVRLRDLGKRENDSTFKKNAGVSVLKADIS